MGSQPTAAAERSESLSPLLLWGMGVTNTAAARACLKRGVEVIAGDDAPSEAMRERLEKIGLSLSETSGEDGLRDLLKRCRGVLPAPGVPDRHPLLKLAKETGRPIMSEFDLAADWDERPIAAVTGTNGKTTVTTILAEALRPGFSAELAGNNDLPLVSAIDKPDPELFVVEASSFRLGRSTRFSPRLAAWLNFAPDHLDVHDSLSSYLRAKASIWRNLSNGSTAVLNQADEVVSAHYPRSASVCTFGLPQSDYAFKGGRLLVGGEVLLYEAELSRRFPHDLLNAAAAAACALESGAGRKETRRALCEFRGLPHRLEFVASDSEGGFYDDSKATTPQAAASAAASFDSLVLIAGGRNKGLDLSLLADFKNVRAVVAIGESAPEIISLFEGRRPAVLARDMSEAVEAACGMRQKGEAVVLSPGCTSFDWYDSYAERGDDFAAAVRFSLGLEGSGDSGKKSPRSDTPTAKAAQAHS